MLTEEEAEMVDDDLGCVLNAHKGAAIALHTDGGAFSSHAHPTRAYEGRRTVSRSRAYRLCARWSPQ